MMTLRLYGLFSRNETPQTKTYLGVLAALGGAIFSANVTIAVSYLRRFSHNVLLFYGGMGGFLLVLMIAKFDEESRIFHNFGNADLPKIIFAAFLGIFANLMAIKSFQMIPPTVASFVRTQQVVFAFILQSAVMNVVPSVYSIIGAVLVVTSALLIPFESPFIAMLPCERIQSLF